MPLQVASHDDVETNIVPPLRAYNAAFHILSCLQAGYDSIGLIYTQIELHKGELLQEDYDSRGNVIVKTRIQRSAVAAINSGLMDASSGLVTATLAHECAEESDD